MDKTTTTTIEVNGQRFQIAIKATDITEVEMFQPGRGICDLAEDVAYVLFANNNELHYLYKEHKWEGVDSGLGNTVGLFFGRPVCVTVRTIKLFGTMVLVVEDTSTIVNHDMIRQWLKVLVPDVPVTDANNVHHIKSYAMKNGLI